MGNEELKPCPFCGGRGSEDDPWVKCEECGVGYEGLTLEDARHFWNRREPELDRALGRLAQVRLAAEQLRRINERLNDEFSILQEEAASEERWANQYKEERDKAQDMYHKLSNKIFEEWCELFLHKQWAYVNPEAALEDIIGWLKKERDEYKRRMEEAETVYRATNDAYNKTGRENSRLRVELNEALNRIKELEDKNLAEHQSLKKMEERIFQLEQGELVPSDQYTVTQGFVVATRPYMAKAISSPAYPGDPTVFMDWPTANERAKELNEQLGKDAYHVYEILGYVYRHGIPGERPE